MSILGKPKPLTPTKLVNAPVIHPWQVLMAYYGEHTAPFIRIFTYTDIFTLEGASLDDFHKIVKTLPSMNKQFAYLKDEKDQVVMFFAVSHFASIEEMEKDSKLPDDKEWTTFKFKTDHPEDRAHKINVPFAFADIRALIETKHQNFDVLTLADLRYK